MRAGLCLLFIAGVAAAQIVQSVPDAQTGLPFSSSSLSLLAQGSLAIISGLPGSAAATASVSLLPANSTTSIPAQVIVVTSNAITFVIPATVPIGDAQLIYKLGTQATQWTRVSIVPANLSLYRTGAVGPLIAQNINPDGTPLLNGLASPAQAGQPVILWGTGLGSTPQSAVQITLGGVAQTVLYAGAAPANPGLSQINFQIAAGTPDGCYVPLTITYGTQSLTSFLSKTSDGLPCHHPFQLSIAAMKTLDGGGQIDTGIIQFSTGIQAPASNRAYRNENASLLAFGENSSGVAVVPAAPTPACSFSPLATFPEANFGFDSSSLGPMTLTQGTSMLALPWTQPPQTDSPLSSLPAPAIAGGNWTWSTPGGSNLPASSFNFVLPPPVQITGSSPITLDRSQNQVIAWNGSSFDSNASLSLSLTGSFGSPVLNCSVPAQTGSVTLPANLLAQFSVGFVGALSVSVYESAANLGSAQFTQEDGSPLLMIVNWSSSDTRPVDFQ